MNTVHCIFCSQQVKVSESGFVMPHRVGKQGCVGSGHRAVQMALHAEQSKKIMPGADLAEKFKKS